MRAASGWNSWYAPAGPLFRFFRARIPGAFTGQTPEVSRAGGQDAKVPVKSPVHAPAAGCAGEFRTGSRFAPGRRPGFAGKRTVRPITKGMVELASTEPFATDLEEVLDTDIEAALDPAEAEGVYRDSTECAALALNGGGFGLLLSPPTPRPKKG
jgi:hypothetical protein